MRRRTRLPLLIGVLLLVLVLGGYTAFWFVTAGRLEDGIGELAESLRAQNLDLSWRRIGVGGFPLAFRLELDEVLFRDPAVAQGAEMRVPVLSASARPWNFRLWRLDAPSGLGATLGPPDRADATIKAQQANGAVAVKAEGGASIRVDLEEVTADAGLHLTAREARVSAQLPQQPPKKSDDKNVQVTAELREVTVPVVPAPLRNPLDELALDVTLMGPVPSGPLKQAATAWRDAGGTVELERLAVRWGVLSINGSGTAALDGDLQPIGSFSGAIEGYDELLAALAAAGRLRPNEASVARLALGFLAKRGPDGRPQISTPFTIQDGQMLLGPVKLGPAPRINWQ